MSRAIADAFPDLPEMVPPIDLKLLARRRGIASIDLAEIENDGLLLSSKQLGFTVQLNKRHNFTRRRFTLAHEIAHTFFFDAQGRGPNDLCESELGHPHEQFHDVEQSCNFAATELLMPHRQFANAIQQHGFRAQSLATLAALFRVSLNATARRVGQLAPLRLAIVLWQQSPDFAGYYSIWATGRFAASMRSERLLLPASERAYSAFESGSAFTQRLWLSLGGPPDDYFVDAVVIPSSSGRKVLTVVVLEKYPELLLGKESSREPSKNISPTVPPLPDQHALF